MRARAPPPFDATDWDLPRKEGVGATARAPLPYFGGQSIHREMGSAAAVVGSVGVVSGTAD